MRCCCRCGAPSDEDDAYRRHVDPAGSSADPAAAVSSVAVGEDDFELLRVLGRGTYGKVVQVRARARARERERERERAPYARCVVSS